MPCPLYKVCNIESIVTNKINVKVAGFLKNILVIV